MRRIRNLGLFAIIASLVALALVVVLRPAVQRAMGVNVDIGSGRPRAARRSGRVRGVGLRRGPRRRRGSWTSRRTGCCSSRSEAPTGSSPSPTGTGMAGPTRRSRLVADTSPRIRWPSNPMASLLVAGETTLFRLRLGADLREAERSVVLEGLTTGGHSTRTVAVLPDGQLLLSAGSTCNVCVESDPRRAAINLVPPEGGSSRVYMTGLRNAVGVWVDPATGRAWATDMGRDWLGDDLPPETIYEVVDGADAGWPRCHAGDLVDPEFGGEGACDGVADPAVTFGAHRRRSRSWAWDGHLVVALHGSWNRSDKAGYALWWLPWDGEPAGEAEPFATGFLPEGAAGRARPPGRPRRRSGRGALRVRRQGRLHLPDRAPIASDDHHGRTIRRSGSRRSFAHVERAVDEQSVADLVEPLDHVTTGRATRVRRDGWTNAGARGRRHDHRLGVPARRRNGDGRRRGLRGRAGIDRRRPPGALQLFDRLFRAPLPAQLRDRVRRPGTAAEPTTPSSPAANSSLGAGSNVIPSMIEVASSSYVALESAVAKSVQNAITTFPPPGASRTYSRCSCIP